MTFRGRFLGSVLRRPPLGFKLAIGVLAGFVVGGALSGAKQLKENASKPPVALQSGAIAPVLTQTAFATGSAPLSAANGRPQLDPLPRAEEVWECEVVVVGGSLGGVAAAHQAMKSGIQTCLIELSPWLGGQISSQGVSAVDESRAMGWRQNFSQNWLDFKQLIRSQPISLPDWTGMGHFQTAYEANSCWVGSLCFLPAAGASAAQQWLQQALPTAPGSHWATSTAFKGAAFDPTGRTITAVYGVKRIPKHPQYVPTGRLSQELPVWYAWSEDDRFEKIPIRLQPPVGKRLLVIDASDTGELVAWAQIPHRIGSDAQGWLGEPNAPAEANPACTQAVTFPFAVAILDDLGSSHQLLSQVQTSLPKSDYRPSFDMEGYPMFHGRSLFNYRRIISKYRGRASVNRSLAGEITLVNWNRGNDWNIIDDPLIMDGAALAATQQYQNWMGGLSSQALNYAEENALVFAEWLLETKATATMPLTFLSGPDSPLGTQSGLSLMPYIREGRRIIGWPAYGQEEFMITETDIRSDMAGGRSFADTAIALAHYD
ncbi:NAD(FAD)-dependent dehydrogenase, partial [filamentous cyanobacterium CCP5]